MKKSNIFISSILASAVILGCVGKVPRDPNKDYELLVLHTNDHHGTTIAKSGKGGLAERGTYFKEAASRHKNVIKLDAGDINTGPAVSNMFDAEPDIRAYNKLGYTAAAFGNHEFDKPLSVLKKQIDLAEFAWLSANIKEANGKYLGKPYITLDFEGFRAGILGLTTLRTKVAASPDKSLIFIDEIEAATDAVNALRGKEKADIVIVVCHIGDVQESDDHTTSLMIAERVPGIDLIVDGHSHSYMDTPITHNGVTIVSSGEWGKFVGEALMTIRNGKVTNISWHPVEITTESYPPDPEVSALLAPFVEKANSSLKEVIAQTDAVFPFSDDKGNRLPRYGETAFGDLICDATADYVRSTGMNIDFALHNGGNIRAELPAGEVTKENILTILPFENSIYVLTLKGTDVLELFTFISTIRQGSGGFPQVSREARFTLNFDSSGNGSISDVSINGLPVDPSKTYRVATNDYLAGGGDGYTALTKSTDTTNTSMLLSDLVIEYIKKLPPPLIPVTDGRIQIVTK